MTDLPALPGHDRAPGPLRVSLRAGDTPVGFYAERVTSEVEVDAPNVVEELVPDPRWRSTDSQGHQHYAVSDPLTQDVTYPTINRVEVSCWCDPDDGAHTVTEYQCNVCNEPMTPRLCTSVRNSPKPSITIVTINPCESDMDWVRLAWTLRPMGGASDLREVELTATLVRAFHASDVPNLGARWSFPKVQLRELDLNTDGAHMKFLVAAPWSVYTPDPGYATLMDCPD